ncbi:MAG: hypothetical protein PSU93_04100 [Methylobacter sp.]|uniref:Uncharacterized protein n=1 Tax=Candidatus Methylobacter titanis TaxID=3053457 RepID=A0AA43TKQ8_9GAMM|nr:hypothetical protein [Candidatus Methylobacter titanis]
MESDQNSQLNFIDSFVLLQLGNEDCWLYPVNTNDTAGIRFARHPYGSDALVAMMASRPQGGRKYKHTPSCIAIG